MFIFLSTGQQHAIKIKCCEHESEAVTLVRNGFWPSTPKQPQVAFDLELMTLLQYLFLECRVSLKSIYQALQWLAPSLSKVYVSVYLSIISLLRQWAHLPPERNTSPLVMTTEIYQITLCTVLMNTDVNCNYKINDCIEPSIISYYM